MAKRFYYDAKGKLKGYSSDKFKPSFGVMWLVLALFALGTLVYRGDKGEEATEDRVAQPSAKLRDDVTSNQIWCFTPDAEELHPECFESPKDKTQPK